MITQHKWHKEIKAWADGAKIEYRLKDGITGWGEWKLHEGSAFLTDSWWEYRIKPQPKQPQYLYAWFEPNYGKTYITANTSVHGVPVGYEYIGKIKLENE